MKRVEISARTNWRSKVEELGLLYHSPLGRIYWNESAYYSFSIREVEQLEKATEEIWQLCLRAAEFAISNGRLSQLGIPDKFHSYIYSSWENEPPSIYGRFDLAYDGSGPPKLLEFNADTPTALLEAAVVQWFWKEELFKTADQWNSLHEKLIDKWKDIRPSLTGNTLYFTHLDNWEDWVTVSYLRQTAAEAGITSEQLLLEQLGWNGDGTLRDLSDRKISSIFKLYPWEWLLQEIPTNDLTTFFNTQWIEPIWKLILSSKSILALLWELFPDNPYLLETYFDGPRSMEEYVVKPVHSREGANIELYTKNSTVRTDGPYSGGAKVFQKLASLANNDGNYAVLGSWYVTDWGPAGMGVRESNGMITDNLSQFIPHIIE